MAHFGGIGWGRSQDQELRTVMDVLLGGKTKMKYYPGTKKPFKEKSEMTISDVWMPLAVPEKREQDVAINLMLGMPTE